MNPFLSSVSTYAKPSWKEKAVLKIGGSTTVPLASMYPKFPLDWITARPSEKDSVFSYIGGMTISPFVSIKPIPFHVFVTARPSENSSNVAFSLKGIAISPFASMNPHAGTSPDRETANRLSKNPEAP